MSLAVSYTTAVSSNADSVTINKPTGVSVGETLLIIANGDTSAVASYASCTGFTQILTSNRSASPYASVSLLYRIADSSDVSASTYTVNLAGAQTSGAVVMMRVQGLGSGSPLFASSTADASADVSSWSLGASSLSLSRPNEQLLILAGSFNGESNAASFSGYNVTSSDSNPTWTEMLDTTYSINSQPVEQAFYCAYAITSNTSNITAWSVNVAASTSGTADAIAGFLAVIVEPINATVSNALFQTTPVTFATLTGSTQEPTNDFMAISPNFPTQSGKAKSASNWTNPDKPTTDWTNTPKL